MPPVLVGAFALQLGGFASGTRPWAVAVGMLVLALCAAWGAASRHCSVLDPLGLGLGRGGRGERKSVIDAWIGMLPWLVLGLGVASWWVSPVPRAGLLFLCYGPWLLLLVPTMRTAMDSRSRRSLAEAGFAIAVLLVSVVALWDWLVRGSPRAAMPLGHHNLLAIWLVAVLPLAVLPSRWQATATQRAVSSGSWGWRGLSLVAAGLGLMALLATRSLGGALGFGVQVMVVVWTFPRPAGGRLGGARLVAALATASAVVLAAGWRRLLSLMGAGDRSMEARWQYLRAGIDGWRDRPLLGSGPGSSSWTLSQYLDFSGLPAQQTVTDVHSLPFDLLYEVGALGSVLAILVALAWVRARRRDSGQLRDSNARAWASAADVSLIGISTTAIVGGFFDVMAVWVLIPMVLGVRLGASSLSGRAPRSPASRIASAVVVVLLGVVCLGPVRAQFSYQRGQLDAAVRSDPGHPLYRASLARSNGITADAVTAAEAATGLAALFLSAGDVARGQGDLEQAGAALARSCDLSPGDPLGPYLLAGLLDPGPFDERTVSEAQSRSLDAVARALLAEPRLLVTPELLARPDVRGASVRLLDARVEIPIGWRAALIDAERALPERSSMVVDPLDLVLLADETSETSLSLFAFRRSPSPVALARATIDRRLAATIQMPPALELEGFDPGIFADDCRLSTRGSR